MPFESRTENFPFPSYMQQKWKIVSNLARRIVFQRTDKTDDDRRIYTALPLPRSRR